MTDHAALRAACLSNPGDDTPRLVLADFLAEHGEEDRAELIRLQVELERKHCPNCGNQGEMRYDSGFVVPCRWCSETQSLRRREKDILSRHTGDKATGERWDRVCCPNPKCKDGWERVGSLASSEGTTAIGWSVGCRTCIGGQGDLALHTTIGGLGSRQLHWDRGFLHLSCQIAEAVEERECDSKDCRNGWQLDGAGGIATDDLTWERIRHARCSGSGRIPTLTAWGRAVLEAGVGLWLEGVEPTDCGEGLWVWNFGTEPGTLPRWLAPFFSTNRLPSSSAAKLSLARAFTAWSAREHANV